MSLRGKLVLGFGGLLLVIAVVGVHSVVQIQELGRSIDVLLRENYESVLACQEMKESMDRIDSGAAFAVLGRGKEGIALLAANEPRFEKALDRELHNITIPGEGEKAALLSELFRQYKAALGTIRDPAVARDDKRRSYFTVLVPLFQRIQDTTDAVRKMNQENMVALDRRARLQASAARKQVYFILFAAMAIAGLFTYLTGKWVLRPITRLIRSAEEIRRGNLDLVLQSGSRDEIGRLTEAFNAMAASLREFRRTDQAKLLRIQRSTQQALNSLPDVIAVLDPEGTVEVSTEAAREAFGLKAGARVSALPYPWMAELFEAALRSARTTEYREPPGVVQRFLRGEERFYHPKAIPIMDSDKLPAGVVLVLSDVTGQRSRDEMKSGVIATVSHQLKTPLTSVRMALHLLLEEKVGAVTEKQAELLVAAREEADRLDRILEELLDLGRIESGKFPMELRPQSPQALAADSVEPYRGAARDGGVSLSVDLAANLPKVWVDPTRIAHVFANLLSNALKYTPPGGRITLSAEAGEGFVRFRVSDTGVGIPAKYQSRLFEQFFRVPEHGPGTGVGLGLAIVKDIVEAHGGSVGVESREGVGSTFFFSLRRADSAAVEEARA